MGWGLIIKDVYFNKVTKNDLPDVLEDADESIKTARERILILAASTPRSVASGEENYNIDWNEHIRTEVDDIMEDLEDQIIRRYLARQCMDSPESVTEG